MSLQRFVLRWFDNVSVFLRLGLGAHRSPAAIPLPAAARGLQPGRRSFLTRVAWLTAWAGGLNLLAPFGVLTEDSIPRRNPSLAQVPSGDGILVFTRDAQHRLIGTHIAEFGAAVWAKIDGRRTTADVVASLRADRRALFTDPHRVEAEISAMREAGLVYFGVPLWELIRYRS